MLHISQADNPKPCSVMRQEALPFSVPVERSPGSPVEGHSDGLGGTAPGGHSPVDRWLPVQPPVPARLTGDYL
ncbi:unnamed protein product [[Candida] boidinii]|uniref:Unnamed protein product n=1 Tax=Candida boidinii TaxID=5477 RepID=A0A9W6T2C1_CANBO|nr:unnamed protein product [[Candida] boidinii]GMF99358.1 unnamed protein product [[Candida] boidinii]